MTIDVSGILKELGGKVEVNGDVGIDGFEFNGSEYAFASPVRLTGSVANNGKALILRAKAEVTLLTECSRCLKDISVREAFRIEESFVRSEDASPDEEDAYIFDGGSITVDDAVRDNLFMNIKGRYLCSEDCRGLCPQCGKDLNDGECGCESEFIDPRWAGLADLMKEDQ